MRWLLVSDTHRRIHVLHAAGLLVPDVELVVHAGDEVADAAWLSAQIDVPVVGVAGNWDRPTADFPIERVCDGDIRALVVHGHRHGVKQDLTILADAASKQRAPVAFFGHTHVPVAQRVNQTIVVNPGSLAEPRKGHQATFALLDYHRATERSVPVLRVTHMTTSGETVSETTFPLS